MPTVDQHSLTDIVELWQSVLLDLKKLANEYAALTSIKLHDGARAAMCGTLALVVGAIMGTVAIAQLTYAAAGLIIARGSSVRESVNVVAFAALLSLIIGIIAFYIGSRFLRTALAAPKSLVTSAREHPPWPTTF